MNERVKILLPTGADDVSPQASYPNVPLRMPYRQIADGLQELAELRVAGLLNGYALNEGVAEFARRCGHSYLYLKANCNCRVDELRRRMWRNPTDPTDINKEK